MKYIVSLLIWIPTVILIIILYFVTLLVVAITYPFDKNRRAAHAQCFWWATSVIRVNPFWKVKVSGLENIDYKKTYVIVANHQSLADIVLLYKTRMQFKWVAKESLFKVPFIGWCLALNKHIKLMRGDLGSIKQVYRQAAQWLRQDMSVLMFPEGTRSLTKKMNPFQNGAFKLAIKEKRAILPISIQGTHEAIPKGGWVLSVDVPMQITVLPAIETEGMASGDFEALKDLVYSKLESVCVLNPVQDAQTFQVGRPGKEIISA